MPSIVMKAESSFEKSHSARNHNRSMLSINARGKLPPPRIWTNTGLAENQWLNDSRAPVDVKKKHNNRYVFLRGLKMWGVSLLS